MRRRFEGFSFIEMLRKIEVISKFRNGLRVQKIATRAKLQWIQFSPGIGQNPPFRRNSSY